MFWKEDRNVVCDLLQYIMKFVYSNNKPLIKGFSGRKTGSLTVFHERTIVMNLFAQYREKYINKAMKKKRFH